MILLIIELLFLIPALIYDWTIASKSKKDITISEDIYKYVHKEPIIALLVGGLIAVLLLEGIMSPLEGVVSGILLGHLLWKA